jgi:hypothetical protein
LIEGIQRMMIIHPPNQGEEEAGAVTGKEPIIEISLATKRHWELRIKTLRDAPRDAEKLREVLRVKQEEYDKAEDSKDIERQVPQIEMLQFVLFLVCGKDIKKI